MDEYHIEEPKKAGRKALSLVAVLILVVIAVSIVYYQIKVNRAATTESHEIKFSVIKGSNTRQIASGLAEKKIISNAYIFVIYSQLHEAAGKIQAGDYSLNSNMAIPEILDILTRGRVVAYDRNVTVIEGLSNRQLKKYLVERNILSQPEDLDKILQKDNFGFKYEELAKKFGYEGFLFPDTYKLGKDSDAEDLVRKMLKNFEAKISDQIQTDMENSRLSLSDVLILASIIEKEVGRNKDSISKDDLTSLEKERRLVASVFYNRLEIGMALESDATVNYVTGKSDRSVSIADTQIKSPYNTYQVKRLPPTPIGNPGIDAIKAAIYPVESDYLFFLNKPDGEAVFSKTLTEHNANKAKYLK